MSSSSLSPNGPTRQSPVSLGSPHRRQRFCARKPDGSFVPLVPADEAPPMIGVPTSLDHDDVRARGYVVVGDVDLSESRYTVVPPASSPPPRALITRPRAPSPSLASDSTRVRALSSPSLTAMLPEMRDDTGNEATAPGTLREAQAATTDSVLPLRYGKANNSNDMYMSKYASPAPARAMLVQARTDKLTRPASAAGIVDREHRAALRLKRWCTHYFHSDGECAFTQVGCKFSHEWPRDWKTISDELGLNSIPDWYKIRYPQEWAELLHDLGGWEHAPWSDKTARTAPFGPNALPATSRHAHQRLGNRASPPYHGKVYQIPHRAAKSGPLVNYDRGRAGSHRGLETTGRLRELPPNTDLVRRQDLTRRRSPAKFGVIERPARKSTADLIEVSSVRAGKGGDGGSRDGDSGGSASSTRSSVDAQSHAGLDSSHWAPGKQPSRRSSTSSIGHLAEEQESTHPSLFRNRLELQSGPEVARVEAINDTMRRQARSTTASPSSSAAAPPPKRAPPARKGRPSRSLNQRFRREVETNAASNSKAARQSGAGAVSKPNGKTVVTPPKPANRP